MSLSFDSFVKGAVSGATGILFSHPIDTIKSNIQNNKPVKFTPKFLVKGIIPPFFGMGIEKAIVFGVYHNILHLLGNEKNKKENQKRDRVIAGAAAGFAASFVVTPIDRLKILAQTGKTININPSFLFRGLSSTFTREMPGFAIYFSTYETMKESLSSKKQLGMIDHFTMGGMSGLLSWVFIYPSDVVKSRIQGSNVTIYPTNVIKDIYKNNGIKGFFRGFQYAMLRAVPLHAGTFMMYEYLNKKFD